MSRADISAGKAHVELYVKNSAFVKGLNRASKQLSTFGKDVMKIGATITAAGGTVVGALASTLSVASDMEEQMNKFNVVFGESAKEMKNWGDETGKALGRSKLQMATFMGSMQDLLVPMGIAPEKARELSKEMTTLAIDVASFNNAADADVIRDFQAALTGSGEVMKKYGVIVSEAAVKQELLSQGLDPKNVTEAQKAQARWNLIVKGTTAAAGDATRSAGSYANQMKALTAAITDARVEIGSRLLPVITPFVTAAKNAIAATAEWIQKNDHYIKSIAFVAAGITALGIAVTGAGAAFFAVGKALGAVSFLLVTLTNPIGLVVFGVAAMTAAWLKFTERGQSALAALVKGFQNLWKFIQPVIKGISQSLAEGDLQLAAEIASAAMEVAFLKAFQAIRSSAWDMVKEIGGMMSDIATAIASGPKKGGRMLAEMATKMGTGGVLSTNLAEAEGRLSSGLARAALPGQQRERKAEIESVRDETSRMTDIDAVVMAQNAAIRQGEAEMNQRIASWMAANAPGGMVAKEGSREEIMLLRQQNRQMELMLNELRMGRAVYE